MSEDGLQVAVLGAAGYVGGELLRLLAGHPDVGAIRGFSASHADRPFGDAHPALRHGAAGLFEPPDPTAAATWADVLFLALPHGESQEIMDVVLAAGSATVIDLAADFRVKDRALYERFYGTHACPERCAEFKYALADVLGEDLRGCTRIAVPGCFATAAQLALYPVASSVGFAAPPVCFAATGSSGSGASPKPTTHHPVRAHNFFAYATTGHRHEAEILAQLRGWTGDVTESATLLPHSAPFVRGIHLTLSGRPAEKLPDPAALLRKVYLDRPFLHVLDAPPELSAVTGTNHAHLFADARGEGEEIVINVVIDNLVKGAAGQALQAMNLALGRPETAGLTFPGIYPC